MIDIKDICTDEKLEEFDKIIKEGREAEFETKFQQFICGVIEESAVTSRKLSNAIDSDDIYEARILAKKMADEIDVAESNLTDLTSFNLYVILTRHVDIMTTLAMYKMMCQVLLESTK